MDMKSISYLGHLKKKKKCICDTKSQHLFPNPIEEVIHLVFNIILHTDAVENFPLKQFGDPLQHTPTKIYFLNERIY